MSLFAQLSTAAAQQGLPFLVIGGHAVIEHGFQRGTEDADILVAKEERERWMGIVTALGYTLLRDGGTFLQFESKDPSAWDLDLMLIPVEVLQRLIASAVPARIEGAPVVVPSLDHLLALKVHALTNTKGLRALKDMTDIAELAKANRIASNSSRLHAIFEKHGTQEMYERVVKLLT